MQNLLLAAAAEGLGTCWMAGANYLEDEILKFLGKDRPANPGHHPHRLPGQGTAGAAPQRAGGALAGV